MWNLFKESPAKREIYEKITSGNVCPLPYCKARWCENGQTAERAALRGVQTHNPIVPFLYFTSKGSLQWLLEKCVLKETLAKSDSRRNLLTISPKDANIWKPDDQVDIGCAAKRQIAEYKKEATYKKSKIYTFCKDVMVLYATTTSYCMETSSIEKSCCSISSLLWPFLRSKQSRWIYKRIWIAVGLA